MGKNLKIQGTVDLELENYILNNVASVRIDRWLMAARFYKTRSKAAQACNGGKVKINRITAKPGKMVHPGDEIVIQQGHNYRKIRVLYLAAKGLPPVIARQIYKEYTPSSMGIKEIGFTNTETEPSHKLKRKYKGRPTKKERRDMKKFFFRE